MRCVASICLAVLLAITLGWPQPMRAATDVQAPAASHCAGMAMNDDAAPREAPVKAPDEGCMPNCVVGCVMPAEQVTVRIGQRIGWQDAFGLPVASLEPNSVSPEAEDPPPRTDLV